MLFTLFIFFLLLVAFILPRTTITHEAARYVESVFGLPPTEIQMVLEDQEKEEAESGSGSESDWVEDLESESDSPLPKKDMLHDSMIEEKETIDKSVKVDEKYPLSGSGSPIDGLVEEITEVVTQKIIEALEEKLKTN